MEKTSTKTSESSNTSEFSSELAKERDKLLARQAQMEKLIGGLMQKYYTVSIDLFVTTHLDKWPYCILI